jgi:hypothetical protein
MPFSFSPTPPSSRELPFSMVRHTIQLPQLLTSISYCLSSPLVLSRLRNRYPLPSRRQSRSSPRLRCRCLLGRHQGYREHQGQRLRRQDHRPSGQGRGCRAARGCQGRCDHLRGSFPIPLNFRSQRSRTDWFNLYIRLACHSGWATSFFTSPCSIPSSSLETDS